jgi:hypothetical protein
MVYKNGHCNTMVTAIRLSTPVTVRLIPRSKFQGTQEEKGEHLEEYAHDIVRAGFNQLICRERTLSASSIKYLSVLSGSRHFWQSNQRPGL